ncbi:MAG: lipoate--protein ligase family protein, partial [candidate division WOR-3 bacterium]|nr:lipoate--protein ligase family protein [candidate division WOR-3 bacterium]
MRPVPLDAQLSHREAIPSGPNDANMFRFLITGAEEGTFNMAVDYAILEKFRTGSVPPTIRFFWFVPPCVSIGRLQSPDTMYNAEYYLVRRPTGGRAVVHQDDLSYSIICKRDNPVFGGDVLDTYMKSSSIFVKAMRLLGIKAKIVRARSSSKRSSLCFQSKSRYEIVSNGKKIIGSAQKREKEFILLQGSISLDIAREKIIEKYRSVLHNKGIEYTVDTLTEQES